jgi:RNA polymerase sigma-70 factor, ECF subfamily
MFPDTAANVVERPLDTGRLGDHVDRLYRAALALCGSREDAEDLVQETFARVLARPRLVRGSDDFGYLLVALRNIFMQHRRKDSRRPRSTPIPDELGLADTRTTGDPVSALEAGELFSVVADLTEDFRDVLVAVDVAGLEYREAAKALRVPVGTVMSRLYRARQLVARQLDAA